MQHHQVVVVGGGPAGSATAALLASAGADVVLLDRARFPRSKPCAEYLSPGAAALLQRLGVLDRLAPGDGRHLRGMELRAPGGERYLVEYQHGGQTLHSLAVSRTELDLALLNEARDRGARVCEGFRVGDLLRSNGRVSGVAGTNDAGRRIEYRARLVVGADGTHSVVTRALGLRKPLPWPRRLGLVAHLAGVPWPQQYGEMHVGRRGYVGVAPIDEEMLSVGLVMPLPRRQLGPPEDALRAALADYPDLAERLRDARPVRPIRGVGPLAHTVRHCAGPGYALVGDAAGFLDPFTGEGMFRALQGAEILAEATVPALATGTGPVNVRSSYQLTRRATFAAKERLTWIIQLFVHAPALMDYAVTRLRQRPRLGLQLGSVLGDLEPATSTLRPAFLWELLRP